MSIVVFGAEPASGAGLNSRVAIERAVLQVELGDYSLARSYLGQPLIDPRITVTERSRAYYLQGYSLELQGHYVSAAQNYAKALAFNADNPATLAALGHLYANGLGIAADATQANELLRRSAELGHAPGMTRLGALLLDGLATSPNRAADLEEARAWLTQATKVDDGEAFLFLAQSYRTSHAATPEPQTALKYYEQALLLNEPAAFNSIGHMHLNGEFAASDPNTTPVDPTAAAEAFARGSAAEDGASQLSLGYLYLLGTGVDLDHNKARELLTRAAANGELQAHHYLGYLAEVSAPDDPAPTAAMKHYERAAAGNHPAALLRLSELAFNTAQPAAGVNYLRRFLSIGPTSKNAPKDKKSYWSANHRMAWLLATHPNAGLRDGAEALKYAQASVSHKRSAATLDTLAAVFAELGDYPQARTTQVEAIKLLTADSPLEDYQERLAYYRRNEAWRDPAP